MSNYLVTAPNDTHGHIWLGEHLASNPENAVQRAREEFEPENMAQELAISKENHFKVYDINEIKEVKTHDRTGN